jgi:hypothetical protein
VWANHIGLIAIAAEIGRPPQAHGKRRKSTFSALDLEIQMFSLALISAWQSVAEVSRQSRTGAALETTYVDAG